MRTLKQVIDSLPPAEQAKVLARVADTARQTRGRPPSDNPKAHLTLRLDADIVAQLRASGRGWQTRLNATLRKALKLRKTG